MAVRNSGESPYYHQVLGVKVQTLSLASHKKENHLNKTKAECRIYMWGIKFDPLIKARKIRVKKRELVLFSVHEWFLLESNFAGYFSSYHCKRILKFCSVFRF